MHMSTVHKLYIVHTHCVHVYYIYKQVYVEMGLFLTYLFLYLYNLIHLHWRVFAISFEIKLTFDLISLGLHWKMTSTSLINYKVCQQ